jgi:three-Cys-motif partner protein
MVLDHKHDFHVPVRFLFIENDPERCAALKTAINQVQVRGQKSPRIENIEVQQGDCESLLNQLLNEVEQRGDRLGPAFFFLDQFGYSDVPMALIRRIMSHPQCEVFSYLNWKRMNQFMADQTKQTAIDKAFGGPEWQEALNFGHPQRQRFVLETYKNALRNKASSRYVWHFAMSDGTDRLLYWLFFCTNSLRGLEEMKRAMSQVDRTGGFRFSDRDNPSQLNLFDSFGDSDLAHQLATSLSGKHLKVRQIEEYVLTETPAYKYKKALRVLEEQGRITVVQPPSSRRKGTFPNKDIEVKFA